MKVVCKLKIVMYMSRIVKALLGHKLLNTIVSACGGDTTKSDTWLRYPAAAGVVAEIELTRRIFEKRSHAVKDQRVLMMKTKMI